MVKCNGSECELFIDVTREKRVGFAIYDPQGQAAYGHLCNRCAIDAGIEEVFSFLGNDDTNFCGCCGGHSNLNRSIAAKGRWFSLCSACFDLLIGNNGMGHKPHKT